MIDYNITIDDATPSLSFYWEDPDLVSAKLALEIWNGITEDDDWYNISFIEATISNSCAITQDAINATIGVIESVEMSATKLKT